MSEVVADRLTIEGFAQSDADLREAKRQLIDLVADLAFENSILRILYEREQVCRIHGDATIERLQRLLERQRAA